jgi:hypothetical protein
MSRDLYGTAPGAQPGGPNPGAFSRENYLALRREADQATVSRRRRARAIIVGAICLGAIFAIVVFNYQLKRRQHSVVDTAAKEKTAPDTGFYSTKYKGEAPPREMFSDPQDMWSTATDRGSSEEKLRISTDVAEPSSKSQSTRAR